MYEAFVGIVFLSLIFVLLPILVGNYNQSEKRRRSGNRKIRCYRCCREVWACDIDCWVDPGEICGRWIGRTEPVCKDCANPKD